MHDGAQAEYDLRTVLRLREAAGWGGGRERRRVKGGKSGGLAAVVVVAASVAGTGRQKQDGSGMCRLRQDVTVRSSEGALAAGCGGGVGSATAALARLARYL